MGAVCGRGVSLQPGCCAPAQKLILIFGSKWTILSKKIAFSKGGASPSGPLNTTLYTYVVCTALKWIYLESNGYARDPSTVVVI